MGKTKLELRLEELNKRFLEKKARGKDTSVEEFELHNIYLDVQRCKIHSLIKKIFCKKHV